MSKSIFFILVFLLMFPAMRTKAQDLGDNYEEILVFLKVQGVGGYDISSIYSYDDNRLFIPVTELFTALRINQETSANYDTVQGYLLREENPYIINYPLRYIALSNDTTWLLENDILKTKFGLYLATGIYGRAFGLYCTFNFRALSVDLKTDLELPAVRDMRLAQMRKNLEMITGEVKVDTIIDRQYHWLKFGMLDWAINSTQTTNGSTTTRLSTAIGAEVLGGETNAILNYTTNSKFEARNQQFSWRWANNKSKYVRQVIAGKISPASISSVYDPLYGFIVTNTPTSYRRSFGEYNLTGYTEPGWTVELYVNNVLVNYKKADASGFYSFEVPLVYGASEVVVKLYGPYGEERIREEPISIPYNFLPKGELEYIIRGGIVDDSLRSQYSRAEASYGVNRFITLGGGMEYYSFLKDTKEIPFLSGSFSPVPNLMFTGEYADKVRAKALVSYRLSSNATVEASYAKYQPGQEVIRFNYLEERKISISIPVKLAFFNGYTRLGFKQNVYENFNYNTADFLISTTIGPVSANLTSYVNWTSGIKPFFNTNASASMRLSKGFTARAQAQIDINTFEIISYRAELEKRITRQGYASVNYEENLRANTRSVNVAFRYDLPFAQTSISSRISKESVQTSEGFQGSLAFGSGNGYVHTDNRSVTGRGGLTLVPFLDINFNNKKDDNEPMVQGLDLRINGGRFLNREKDSLTRVMDLEPYSSVLIELNNDGFDNIAWQLRDHAMRVYIDPNQFKRIEIPVYPMGEINGMVYIKSGNKTVGQGRILIRIITAEGEFVKKIMSERDGYYTFLGLAPGDYYAMLDDEQMTKLKWKATPAQIPFTVQPSEWGDIIDGIDFTINQEKEADESAKPEIKEIAPENVIEKPQEEIPVVHHEALIDTGMFKFNVPKYFVQAASVNSLDEAVEIFNKLKIINSCPMRIIEVKGLFKVRFGYFKRKTSADTCYLEIMEKGFDVFIGMDKNERPQVIKIPPEVQQTIHSPAPETEHKIPVPVTTIATTAPGQSTEELDAFIGVEDADTINVIESSPGPENVVIPEEPKSALGSDGMMADSMVSKPSESAAKTISPEEQPPSANVVLPAGVLSAALGKYFVQTGSFNNLTEAVEAFNKLRIITSYPMGIVEVNGMFKLRFGYFESKASADKCHGEALEKGFDAFIGMDKSSNVNIVYP